MTDNTLNWERLDKNETIEELIRKINYNFSQFGMHNGGTPGKDGKDGTQGIYGTSRVGIHTVTNDELLNKANEKGLSIEEITFPLNPTLNVISTPLVV